MQSRCDGKHNLTVLWSHAKDSDSGTPINIKLLTGISNLWRIAPKTFQAEIPILTKKLVPTLRVYLMLIDGRAINSVPVSFTKCCETLKRVMLIKCFFRFTEANPLPLQVLVLKRDKAATAFASPYSAHATELFRYYSTISVVAGAPYDQAHGLPMTGYCRHRIQRL